MKKIVNMIILCMVMLSAVGCSAEPNINEKAADFNMSSMSAGLGSLNENNLEESRYTYTINILSGNKKIEKIIEVKPILGDKISDKVITEEPTQIKLNKDYLEIKGEIVFDTKGLSKEQIVALEPYITSIVVILNDKTNSIVMLSQTK